MRKKLLFFIFMSAILSINAQSIYKTCGGNKVENSTFDKDWEESTSVQGWTFTPEGNKKGWKKAETLIYGTYLVINRVGSYTASPNNVNLCLILQGVAVGSLRDTIP